MTDILMPPTLRPASMTWTLERNEARFESPTSRTVQRVARGGDRWRCTLQLPQLVDDDAGALNAWLDQISRADNAALVPVTQNALIGESAGTAFADQQILFANRQPALDWTSIGLLQPIYTRSGDAVLYAMTTSAARRIFPVTQGLPYEIIIDIPPQTFPGGYYISNVGGLDINRRDAPPGAGEFRHLVIAGSANLTLFLYAGNGNQSYIPSHFRRVSVARVYLNEAAAAAGAVQLPIYGGASGIVTRTLAAGQFFNVVSGAGLELKRVQADVDQIGAITLNGITVNHLGRCVFEPALRGPVPINSAISTLSPLCRMLLATATASSTISPPIRHGVTLELVEDVT
ncbi:MAG: hypothetical protein M0P19_09305 [Nevskia sp.]|jgi:hypothetical protein|nr:hypothetical protein [Nevskia sp.]MCK9385051.1 hypothetical protein [Nevskia sp.]